MKQDAKNMTCAEFQAHLPELIGSGENVADHPHLQTCELCRTLLDELETIAEAARQLFPVADPPDALWDHIISAIESGDESPQKEPKAVDSKAAESAVSLSAPAEEAVTSKTDLSPEVA